MIRRGERGWVGKGGPLWSPVGDGGSGSVPRVEMNGDTGDHKGPPSHSAPPSPLRNPGPASSIDAYWRTLAVALVILKQQ